MNINEAKQILLAWRPGCPELEDNSVGEALALAEAEPKLKEWLSLHGELQERAALSLRGMPVPVGLREAILLRAQKIEPFPVLAWWQQRRVWAAAAVVMLLVGTAMFWIGDDSDASVEVFRSRMVGAVLRQYSMDIVTNDMAAVRSFLAAKQAPADYVLTEKLGRLPVSGAGVLSWRSEKVSMVCLDSPQRGTLFLFVVDAAAVDFGSAPTREFAIVKDLATVTWTNAGRTYVLAGQGGRAELERYLQGG